MAVDISWSNRDNGNIGAIHAALPCCCVRFFSAIVMDWTLTSGSSSSGISGVVEAAVTTASRGPVKTTNTTAITRMEVRRKSALCSRNAFYTWKSAPSVGESYCISTFVVCLWEVCATCTFYPLFHLGKQFQYVWNMGWAGDHRGPSPLPPLRFLPNLEPFYLCMIFCIQNTEYC